MNGDRLGLGSPGARDAIAVLVDDFSEVVVHGGPGDPLRWPGYAEQRARARARSGESESVVAGHGTVAGTEAMLIATDFRYLGGSMGEASGARIVAGFQEAERRGVPVVSLIASGGARIQEGMRSLIQMQRIAAAIARARRSGIPHVSVLRNPTTGGVWASLAATADVVFALAGATVAFAGPRVRGDEDASTDVAFAAEGKLAHGFVDAVGSEAEIRGRVGLGVKLLAPATRGQPLPAAPPAALGREAGEARRGWEQVLRARDPSRPRAEAYLGHYFDSRLAIVGDRAGGTDAGMLCGFGSRGGRTIAYVAQTGTRNAPAGFRSAARLIALASRLRIPVLTVIDTPGALHNASAERAGVGTAIAELFLQTASSEVPITSVVIGEGGSGGALALASHDDLWVTPDAYFSVIAPEGAAAILERDAERADEIVERMALRPADLVHFDVVRGIAPVEPGAGEGLPAE